MKKDEGAQTPAEPTGTPAPAAPKEKGPRREGTKVAAANRIASTHTKPQVLLDCMDLDATQVAEMVKIETEEIARIEASAAERKAALRGLAQFFDEIAGLPPIALVGIRAVLTERAK